MKTVLDKVIYRGVPDYATQVVSQLGDLDATIFNRTIQFNQEEMPNQLHTSDILKVFLGFNTQKAPFDIENQRL